jgi:transcriptional regulator with PAS, ATPase and Fis domain
MDWVEEFPSAVTVCNTQGVVLALNRKACATFASDGGAALIGTNLLACHPEPARSRVAELLRTGEPNTYTIEKGGVKKLIHQSPWFSAGVYRGFVEISIPLPPELPHFKRD